MKRVSVGGMSEASYEISTLERIRDEGLGDYTVLFVGPWPVEVLCRVIAFCREHKIKFVMDEMWSRLRDVLRENYAMITPQEMDRLIAEAGEAYDGTLFMCEYGGLGLYWPESTIKGSPNAIPPTACAAEAEGYFISKLRDSIARAEQTIVRHPLICIEASAVARYLYRAGIDRVDLEVTYDRFNELYHSAVKGATLAYGKGHFGADMAMVWYGGNEHDDLWRHRWRVSLYHTFMRGADPIYAEHGLMDYKALGKDLSTDAPEVKAFRRELAGLAGFAKSNPRPSGFPEARIAFVQGNLDSFAQGQSCVWGQRGENGVPSGTAEESWELFNVLYKKRPWEFRYRYGDQDLSGNPPLGQADIIPSESPLSLMQEYDCLIFLGWNTMTPELYEKMLAYVRQGGHLLATLAHLDTRTRRDTPISLINGGDLRELFGVRAVPKDGLRNNWGIKFLRQPSVGNYHFPLWTVKSDPKYDDGGFPMAALALDGAEIIAAASDSFSDNLESLDGSPILTVKQCDKGASFLVNSTEFPGCRGLRRFYADLLDFFSAAWQGDVMIETSDLVRFAVYRENDLRVIYILNTDPGCLHQANITVGVNEKIPLFIHPGELVMIYATDRCLAVPADKSKRIVDIRIGVACLEIFCHGEAAAEMVKGMTAFVDGREWKGEIIVADR